MAYIKHFLFLKNTVFSLFMRYFEIKMLSLRCKM